MEQDGLPLADQSPEHGSENTTNITEVCIMYSIGLSCLKVIFKKKKGEIRKVSMAFVRSFRAWNGHRSKFTMKSIKFSCKNFRIFAKIASKNIGKCRFFYKNVP